ncbi:9169_t:CDS:2, partial [Entrophospora sp. SA101]
MLINNFPEIEEIHQHINKINEKIPPQQEEVVIIIGDTGEGKSSLLNYLAEVPLFGKKGKGFGRFVIYTESPLEGSEITDGCISKTSLPSGWKEYWDCPGFGDTRGEVQDIVNAYSIYKLIKSAKKVKVLVTVSEATITGSRSRSFLNLIHNIGETFKNTDEDKLVQGLCLVVTKNKTLDLEEMRNGLLEILKEQDGQGNFSPTQKKILGFLSSPESQIVFFNAPTGEGLISDEDRSQILDSISKIPYLEKPEPSISIAPESKNLIKGLADKLNDDIENFMIHKFYPGILDYLDKLIDNHSGTVKELRESQSLKYFCDQLNKISNEPQQFENNLCQISSITKLFQRKELEEEFDKKIFQLEFIKLIKPESLKIKGNTSSWYHSIIYKSIQDIDTLKTPPEKDQQGKVLTFKGLIIGAEDINAAMEDKELSEVNVYSLNSLFIDEDIIAPGVNLTLMSPKWHVVGKRKISLKGKPGTWHQPSKAVDGINEKDINKEQIDEMNGNKEQIDENDGNKEQIDENDGNSEKIDENDGNSEQIDERDENSEQIHGRDGLPGLPGYNGGHFYAKGKKFFNLSSLTIDVSGGDGGQGQDGGNGGNGLDGSDIGKEIVESRDESALVSRKKVMENLIVKGMKFLFTFNDKFTETYESYDPGHKGGNGGQGGKGGFEGKPGLVVIDSPFQLSDAPAISKAGSKKGVNGTGGEPGKGGENVKYCGVYINEMVLPELRGYNELDLDDSEDLESKETITGVGLAGTGIATATGGIIAEATAKELVLQQSAQLTMKEGAKQLVSKGWWWQNPFVITEGSKLAMQEVSKNTFNFVTLEAAEEITKQGGKVIIQDVLKVGATESGKHVVKVGASTGASLAKGMGVGLIFQAALSSVSAHLSSGWEEEAHKVDCGYAPNGETPNSFNDHNIQRPSDHLKPSINKEEKSDCYNQFYAQRKKGHLLLDGSVGDDEVEVSICKIGVVDEGVFYKKDTYLEYV